MRSRFRTACLVLSFSITHFLMGRFGFAQDWPQWRGRDRDGVVHGVSAPKHWPESLTEEWQVPVGRGVASPVVVGGKIIIFTRANDDEFVLCLDLAQGHEIWRSEKYAAPYPQLGPGEDQNTADQRPRSTPAVAEGRIYLLGMSGVVSCLDAATGRRVWRAEYPSLPYGGASPLVTDGLCIVHVGDGKTGGLTAFDARTGGMQWCCADSGIPPSGSPIVVDLAGQRQVVTLTGTGLVGVAVATGKKLWETPCGAGSNTPVLYQDLLIFAAGNQIEPLRAVRVEKGEKGLVAKEVWAGNGHPLYYNSPVVADDLVFGMAVSKSGHLFCLNAATGETLWEGPARLGLAERREASASLVRAGKVLLILTDGGRLLVVKPTSTRYEPIAEYRLSDNQTWAHPVFLGDRLLIRDRTTLRSFRIEDAPPSP
jgi:outer membrane protein assembly factor BamB